MKLCIKASQFPDHIGNLLHVCQGFEPEQLIDIQIDKHRQRRSLDANAYCWVLLDKLAAFRGMGLWALRLSFTTENAGEVDKVLADWVRGGTFEPGSYTRGLYQRGVE